MTRRFTVGLRHLLEGPEDAPVFVLSNSLGTTLGLVCAPTLVVVGADDPAAMPDQAESIRDSIPNASLEVVPDAAHLASIEQPEAIAHAILDHLSPIIREGR